jgi:hypothetical protein
VQSPEFNLSFHPKAKQNKMVNIVKISSSLPCGDNLVVCETLIASNMNGQTVLHRAKVTYFLFFFSSLIFKTGITMTALPLHIGNDGVSV